MVMHLDKYIKMLIIKLSKDYEISMVEITKCIDDHITRNYTINYKLKDSGEANVRVQFPNKRKLVSWLIWLEQN